MKITLEDKIAHVAAWRLSGLTQRVYCELHQINYNSFKVWSQLAKKVLAASESVLNDETVIAETVVVDKAVVKSENQLPSGIIPVTIVPQQTASVIFEKPTDELQSEVKQTRLKSSSERLALNEIQPPPEISIILTSGLQIKCDILLLSQVLKVVEHV